MDTDLRLLACNVAIGDKVFSPGTKCYVVDPNTGWGGETSIQVYGRSRGGRHVCRWVRTRRLHNFRIKTIVPSDPLYVRLTWLGWQRPEDELRLWGTQIEQYAAEQRERNGLQIEERKPAV